VFLKRGETRLLTFSLSPADVAVTDINGIQVALKGKLTISAGGSQPDEKNATTGNIVQKTVTIF
jgi:beta-glucosidase